MDSSGTPLVQIRSQLAMDSDSDSDTTVTPNKEPFPDFDAETCGPNRNRYEAEWARAFRQAVQEDIRTRYIEPYIIPHNLGEPFTRSNMLLEDIKDLLADPHMRQTTRNQFLTMVNHTLHLHQVIFHHSDQFLDTKEITEARYLVDIVLSYMGWIDGKLRDQVSAAEQVSVVLEQLSKEKTTVIERYSRMATVVSAHLKKPRPLERRLLTVFLDFYETWVHTTFLRLRNHQILVEDIPVLARIDLSRRIIAVWDVLSRCIENYSLYTWATRTIRTKYFAPAIDLMSETPDIWQKSWNKRSTVESRRSTHPGLFEEFLSDQPVETTQQPDSLEGQHSTRIQSTSVAELEVAGA
ncbi:hypothetical protein PENANT_c033G01675 [Penicillium antarcticum]|uniref:Uncharacterized protein n=1 Tax=Penicillium antarcticum TaxID=416450 RepID=A0A1V6PUP9_9EURO|nr:uncharacterized protein N7508_000890 [Penicillium antarcticum]KAJ5320607.1 hypothetical protein N7508_000890 [Penicillium antarcticum]OQD80769.1 hypothetical protein PENANT_c033G01675 [Penicillium antarcticum]